MNRNQNAEVRMQNGEVGISIREGTHFRILTSSFCIRF
jgi:hypothetical protein